MVEKRKCKNWILKRLVLTRLKSRFVNTNFYTIIMANFYCKWCGAKHTTIPGLTSSVCSKNPEGKKHALYEGGEKSQYACKCCGAKYSSIAGLTSSVCSKSPTKKHQPAL